MKRLILVAAVAAVLSGVYACGSSTKNDTVDGAAIKAKIEKCTNPDSLKVYVKQARDYARKLKEKGDSSAAAAFVNEVAPVIKEKGGDASAEIRALAEQADYTTVIAADSAKTTMENAADSVKKVATSAYNSAKDAVSDKASEVKDAAVDKYNSAKDATAKAVDDAKAKAAEALQSGADKLKK
ncbi:hypothetical protein [uncultured Muribaculum sp.]|uniref:hypothetical protein n=1 Tax=uncultured Muribaculum sp. TaxID=1918613 RepID=UPI0025FC725C|nr:hypothetical protein [uncultured Muribaculum sp.]